MPDVEPVPLPVPLPLVAGDDVTVRIASLEVTDPELLVATVPLSALTVAGVVYVADVAPPMGVPFFRHTYVGVGVPVAPMLKAAV